MSPLRNIFASLVVGGFALAAGCHSADYDRTFYNYDPHRSRTRAILDVQYAKGAAEDATLVAGHFDGSSLNGLGRDKVDRMLEARGVDGEIVVYLDLPEGDQSAAVRAQNVLAYLAAWGVNGDMARVEEGPAPDRASASKGIAAVDRQSGESGTGAARAPAGGSAGLLSSGR